MVKFFDPSCEPQPAAHPNLYHPMCAVASSQKFFPSLTHYLVWGAHENQIIIEVLLRSGFEPGLATLLEVRSKEQSSKAAHAGQSDHTTHVPRCLA